MSKIENAENVRLFALNSNQPLARRLSEKLGLPLSDATITHFADGEISITINESVVVAKYMFCNPFLSRLTPI